jgi:hypothetical protein
LIDSEASELLRKANVVMRRGMSKPRIVYTPRRDATREGELNALAAVYKLVLASAEKKVDRPCDQDDGKGDERAPVPRSVSPEMEAGRGSQDSTAVANE